MLCKIIVSIHGLFLWNFWNMLTLAEWSFTEGTDLSKSSKIISLTMALREHF